MTDKKEDFPVLGVKEEKKTQKANKAQASKNEDSKAKNNSQPADGEKKEEKKSGGLKLGSRSFNAKPFKPKPKPVVKINYYIIHEEPAMNVVEYFPTLDGKVEEKPQDTEAVQKHMEFMERHEMFKPYISLIPKEIFFVPEECIDEQGFPNMGMLPDLYSYLWNTYN